MCWAKKTAMRQRKITLLVIYLSLIFFCIQQYTIAPLVEKNHAAFALKPSKRSILHLAISNHSSLDSPVQRLAQRIKVWKLTYEH